MQYGRYILPVIILSILLTSCSRNTPGEAEVLQEAYDYAPERSIENTVLHGTVKEIYADHFTLQSDTSQQVQIYCRWYLRSGSELKCGDEVTVIYAENLRREEEAVFLDDPYRIDIEKTPEEILEPEVIELNGINIRDFEDAQPAPFGICGSMEPDNNVVMEVSNLCGSYLTVYVRNMSTVEQMFNADYELYRYEDTGYTWELLEDTSQVYEHHVYMIPYAGTVIHQFDLSGYMPMECGMYKISCSETDEVRRIEAGFELR